MNTRILAALALTIASAACGTAAELRPAPGTAVAPAGPGEGAVASDQGVRMEVRSKAWSGDPILLTEEMTPLFIEITNNSDHQLLVRHRSIALLQGGIAYAAIPPHDIEETVRDNFITPAYGYYPGAWSDYSVIELPTRDMVAQALPEGMLEPGQKISGFVFFEDLDDDIAEVVFTAPLVEATKHFTFGNIEIPFEAY
jgi:hypothetical protein